MASNSVASCAVCGKDATFRCARCAEGLDVNGELTTGIRYCSKDCQTAHWREHKSGCKASVNLKLLYRVEHLIQKAFDNYRRSCFEHAIQAMETDSEGALHVRCTSPELDNPTFEERLVGIPEDTHLTSEQVKAVIVCGAREDALAKMVPFALKFSTISKSDEVLTMPKVANKVILHSPTGTTAGVGALHHVFRIRVGGATFAMDLCGAQFGLYRTITPWSVYAERYIARIESTQPTLSHAMAETFAMSAETQDPFGFAKVTAVRIAHAHCFTRYLLDRWQHESGAKLPDVLKMVETECREGVDAYIRDAAALGERLLRDVANVKVKADGNGDPLAWKQEINAFVENHLLPLF